MQPQIVQHAGTILRLGRLDFVDTNEREPAVTHATREAVRAEMDCSTDGADATAAYPLNGRLRLVTTKSTRRLRQSERRQRSSNQRHVASAVGDQRRQIRVPIQQTAATRQQGRDIPRLGRRAWRCPALRHQRPTISVGLRTWRRVGAARRRGASSRQPPRSWQPDAWAFRAARPVPRPGRRSAPSRRHRAGSAVWPRGTPPNR
jgi:hypothetical protein